METKPDSAAVIRGVTPWAMPSISSPREQIVETLLSSFERTASISASAGEVFDMNLVVKMRITESGLEVVSTSPTSSKTVGRLKISWGGALARYQYKTSCVIK